MHVALVGPGRLGRSLALLWERAGVVTTLHGRGEPPDDSADLVVLTVPDARIADVAATFGPHVRLVHCSGATSLDALGDRAARGSLHPLMTFPGPEIAVPDLTGVPAALDASDDDLLALLEDLARRLGLVPVRVPGDRRLYHAAAVMAGNFATVLLAEAGRVLAQAGVPASRARAMLAPLALASIRNAVDDPAAALTGPIARRDLDVLSGHKSALAGTSAADAGPLYDLLVDRALHLLATEGPNR